MRRHLLAAVAAATLLAGAYLPHSAAAPPADGGPYRVQLISRAGKALAPFHITVNASTDNGLGMWRILEIERAGRSWRQREAGVGGFTTGAATVYPSVYGLPGSTAIPTCPDMPGCTHPVPFDGSRGFTAKPTATSRYYVISAYYTVNVVLDTKAWRLQDIPSPGARRVFGPGATTTGGGTLGRFVERFTSASATGGRYGSAVFAAVPCDEGGQGSARLTGRGAIDSTGGMEPPPLRCSPTTHGGGLGFAYTPVQATWRLDGDVTGATGILDRLFVFDFPKP